MEGNNEAAARIVQKEYAKAIEKLLTGMRELRTHLVQMPEVRDGNRAGAYSASLDTWMHPAGVQALHEDYGRGNTTSFFVYRKPLVVPTFEIRRARANAANGANRKTRNHDATDEHASLMIAMIFNFGLAHHLSYIDQEEGGLNDGSRPEYGDLLDRASQMYDLAIVNFRRMAAASGSTGSTVSSNIQFFRAAMNNLAVSVQTRCVLEASRSESCPMGTIPFNKGFERLRELLVRYPPASDDPGKILWNNYVSNVLRVLHYFHPNYCAPAC